MYARNQKQVSEANQRIERRLNPVITRLIGAILIIIGLTLVMYAVFQVKQDNTCKYQDPQLQCN